VLHDGRIAVSGGPKRFEVLIYTILNAVKKMDSNLQGRGDSAMIVESLDTLEIQVQHMFEV
jgi:hypothetical protein